LKEFDIRPADLFNRYLKLCENDVRVLFSDKSDFVDLPCPACGSSRSELSLKKIGMTYASCLDCGSLFLSPRPSRDLIKRYYEESEGMKFWVREFYRETEAARRKALFAPRTQLVVDLQNRYGKCDADTFVDVGSGYGLQLEEIQKTGNFGSVIGVEPGPEFAEVCRAKGFHIIQKPVEEVGLGEIRASFVTAFEVFEHVYDPETFLKALKRAMRPGGLLLLTTLTVSGFDIQTLWEHSKAVHPPAHINLLSLEGMKALFNRAGLKIIDMSTPGKLDVDIVRNTIQENPHVQVPRFIRQIIFDVSDEVRTAFQQFLREHQLSSHLRIIAQS